MVAVDMKRDKKIKELYDDGYSVKMIGVRFGIYGTTVCAIAKRMNCDMRTKKTRRIYKDDYI